MRWLIATALTLVSFPALAQQNEAEKLFREMEKKILSAQSLSMVCEVQAKTDPNGQPDIIKGTYQLAAGNKLRMEFTGKVGGMNITATMHSDGRMMVIYSSALAKTTGPLATPANLNIITSTVFARGGVIAGIGIVVEKSGDFNNLDLDKKFPVKNFSMGPKEQIGGGDTQVIEYVAGEAFDEAKFKLWLDRKTMLPVKRQMTVVQLKELAFTETYSEIQINPKLDPKIFELPKSLLQN